METVLPTASRHFFKRNDAIAVAVLLPGLCISKKFLLFSDTDDGPLRPNSILVFNILILNELTDFVLVQIVSTVLQKKLFAHRRNDSEMGRANSLHASTKYSERNERLDFVTKMF